MFWLIYVSCLGVVLGLILFAPGFGDARKSVEKYYHLWRTRKVTGFAARFHKYSDDKGRFFAGENTSIPGGAKVAAWKWIQGEEGGHLSNYLNDLDTIYAEIGTVKSKLARTRDDLLDEFKREGILLEEEEKEHHYKQLLDPGYAGRVVEALQAKTAEFQSPRPFMGPITAALGPASTGIFGGAFGGPTALQVHYPGETIRAQFGPQSLSGQRPATPLAAAARQRLTAPTLPPLLTKLGWRLDVYRDLANKVTMYRAHKAPPYSGPPEAVVRFELGDEQSPEEFADMWREFLGKISVAEQGLKPKTDPVAAEELRKAMGGK